MKSTLLSIDCIRICVVYPGISGVGAASLNFKITLFFRDYPSAVRDQLHVSSSGEGMLHAPAAMQCSLRCFNDRLCLYASSSEQLPHGLGVMASRSRLWP